MLPRIAVLAALALLAALPLADAGGAVKAGQWVGQATNMKGDFKYGKVTFKVKGNTIRNLKIESVTTSGCGGFKSVIVPKLTIKGTRFIGAYQPVPGVDDIISVNGTIKGGKAKGTFSEGPLCQNAGRFTARAKERDNAARPRARGPRAAKALPTTPFAAPPRSGARRAAKARVRPRRRGGAWPARCGRRLPPRAARSAAGPGATGRCRRSRGGSPRW